MQDMLKKRINYSGETTTIAKAITEAYELGTYISSKTIDTGYEDYNLALTTTTGHHFVKIFASIRDDEDCKRYIEIMHAVIEQQISTPKILASTQGYLHRLTIEGNTLRLCVQEYIEGEDFYHAKEKPTPDHIRFLAEQLVKIHTTPHVPRTINDQWAANNFKEEFAKKATYLDQADRQALQPHLETFNQLPFDTLPRCLVHGDIIDTNVMKDKDGQLYIIDFSVTNIYPRIQEIAVMASTLLFDEHDQTKSERSLQILLDTYQQHIPLTKQEQQTLPTYILLAHASHLLNANYEEKALHNTTEENKYWLRIARIGLQQHNN
jgi:Ser/Thr protein kinase RdoA (MazF antagonist)